MKIELDKTKERDGVTYHLSLITEDWYFYSDYKNFNPKTNTLGFDKQTNEECAPEHAYFGLYMYLHNQKNEKSSHFTKIAWISDELNKIYQKVKK
tara:strand:- start:30787 stop:31071 length:285 start_codon:yes stop_codon:yes gene_type:complete